MIKTKSYAYLIHCHSNLHVGSGDNNYGVIDKEVQRDTISNQPVIHASGLKGALREYLKEEYPKEVITFFGSEKAEKETFQRGEARFYEAKLLSIPVRSTGGNESFYRATTKDIISGFNTLAKAIEAGVEATLPEAPIKEVDTEYGKAALKNEMNFCGKNTVEMSKDQMSDLLKHLPVIARNSLDNGISENLWYEEVVPRESRFYFFVTIPENYKAEYESTIDKALKSSTVQIGANATVGYGLCKISKMQ